jgi:hypothetical protein
MARNSIAMSIACKAIPVAGETGNFLAISGKKIPGTAR